MLANLVRKTVSSSNWVRRLVNLYAPFRGAGIQVKAVSKDYHHIRVEMPLTWYNRNYVGTHFGGSMYAMTDPFYMLMLIQILGRDYIVWDKAARIEFIKPGTRRLVVEFKWEPEEIEKIKRQAASGDKLFVEKRVEIQDDQGTLIATVDKTLYIRKKTRSGLQS